MFNFLLKKTIIINLFLFFAANTLSGENITKDIRVAVFSFENKSNLAFHGNNSSLSSFVEDELTAQLYKSGEVNIIERTQLKKVIQEQNFQMSGIITQESAVEVGRMLGIDYAIFGSINRAIEEHNKGGSRIGDVGVNVSKSTATATIHMKMIDIETGEIVFMENFTKKIEDKTVGLTNYKHKISFSNFKEFNKTLLSKAIKGSIKKIVSGVVKFTRSIQWTGRIAKIKDNQIYINAGSKQGIEVGMILEVFKVGDQIIDPSSGRIIGEEMSRIGVVKVENNSLAGTGAGSICSVLTGKTFKINDLVQILPENKGIVNGSISIYQYKHKEKSEHIFTNEEKSKKSWKNKGPAFYAFPQEFDGSIPIYVFYNKSNSDRLYTKNKSPKGNWKDEGIAFYAFGDQISGTKPIYQYTNKDKKDHLYTKSKSPKGNWKNQKIAFYAFIR